MPQSRDGTYALSAHGVEGAFLQPLLQDASGDLCPLALTFGLLTLFLPCLLFL